MFSVQILMTSSLLVSSVHSSLLETLLEDTLRTASCQARCLDVASDQLQDCLQICSQVMEDPAASICLFPRFCTGGCRAACQSERREEVRLSGVSQQECGLSWRMDDHHNNVVFIVAGLDQGGMFSIISPHQVAASLPLSPATTAKFTEITILAVDRQGLRDIKTVLIQEVETCPLNTQETLSQTPADFIDTNLVHICLVVIIAIIILTILIIKLVKTVRRQAGKQSVKKETLEDVYYSDNIFLICQESLAEDVKYLNLV